MAVFVKRYHTLWYGVDKIGGYMYNGIGGKGGYILYYIVHIDGMSDWGIGCIYLYKNGDSTIC